MKRKIMFVDDESKLLEGLRRMLRAKRHEWDMRFVGGGIEALKILNQEPFDVVITDMIMPGIDGAQLLTQIRERFPGVVRIVLSGHSDQEKVLKSVSSAHQYISKPCDADHLIDTINRSCRLQNILEHESLKRIISGIGSLPSLPSVYTQLMEKIQSPDGSTQEIIDIIEKDIGITSKILQLVNSAFFGNPCHISSTSQAVKLLGFNLIRDLALTVGVFTKFNGIRSSVLSIEKIYTHSIRTGSIAKEIARNENLSEETIDGIFIAGLLHDIGKLVLVSKFPEIYRNIYELSRRKGIPVFEEEKNNLGTTHAEVGAYLLGLWGFPNTVVEGIAFHHYPDKIGSNGFNCATAVYAANILEHSAPLSHDPQDVQNLFDNEYIKQIDVHDRIPVWINIARKLNGEDGRNE